MHKGLFGRAAGSVPDFDYSAAMRASGIVWSEVTLDQFLQGPRKMVPGTKMTFIGVPAAKDRADLIAYLKQATKP
jgi:cytochrome c